MRYYAIRSTDISNGTGIGVSLFTAGCSLHCKNCQNSELWSFDAGELYTQEQENIIIDLLSKPYINRFSILGGEPIEDVNLYELNKLCKRIKNELPHIKIWLYTGRTWADIQALIRNRYYNKYLPSLLENIDIMVDGPFVQEQKDISLAFRGSKNQRIIDVRESLKQNKVIDRSEYVES